MNAAFPGAEAETPAAGPVTVVVARRARKGREKELEAWLRDCIAVTAKFAGYEGASVLRPRGAAQPEHVLIFRFASYAGLRGWQTSPERDEWLAKAEPFTEHVEVHTAHGLEPFFDLPSERTAPPPPRWKMAVVTWVTLYPLIVGVGALASPLVDGLPFAVATLATSALTVVLMTWLAMPRMTRLLARWLYPT